MTEETRCEPPPELRERNGWHWVETYGRERCAYWWERTAGEWCWWNTSGDDGWRYLAPVPPPAVVAALVEALDAAVDCGMVPSGSAAEGGANRFVRQLQVADMIRAAVALYRGQQPPAPAPTPEPPIYDDSVERNFQSALERGEVKRTE